MNQPSPKSGKSEVSSTTAGTLPMLLERTSAKGARRPSRCGSRPWSASQAIACSDSPVSANAAVTPNNAANSSSRCQSTAPIIVRLDMRRDSRSRPAMARAPISRGRGVENRPTRATSASRPLAICQRSGSMSSPVVVSTAGVPGIRSALFQVRRTAP